jgi:hypothetical protein
MAENTYTPIYITEEQKAELLEYYTPKLATVMEQIERLLSEASRIKSFIRSIKGYDDPDEIAFQRFWSYPTNGSWNQKIQAILKQEDRFMLQSEIMNEILRHEMKKTEAKTISGVLSSKDSEGSHLFIKQKRENENTRYGLTEWVNENGEIKDEYKLK